VSVFRGTLFAPSDDIMGTNNSILAPYRLYSKETRDGCDKGSLLSQSSTSFFTLQAGSSFGNRDLFTRFRLSSGQTAVEFTLAFLLFLVVVWIPADFGLAFYTGQLAQNSSREAARIAAADPNLAATTGSCNMPCSSAAGGTALKAAADRMSRALLHGALISVSLEPPSGANCNRLVEVSVSGEYKYFFYQLLRAMGNTIPDTLNIVRSTSMRWEHQPGCQAA
jgi:Flp pilus assembly protein TadG